MYIKTTTRCNMACPHCMYSCTNDGENMSLKTFKNALKLYRLPIIHSSLHLGGGEPTLHKCFRTMVRLAMRASKPTEWLPSLPAPPLRPPCIITNGSQTQKVFYLLNLASQQLVQVALSLDKYHAPIDPQVVKAFKRQEKIDPSYISIKCAEHKEIKAGRCTWGRPIPPCPGDLCVEPNGDINYCSCPDSFKVGNVNGGFSDASLRQYLISKHKHDGCQQFSSTSECSTSTCAGCSWSRVKKYWGGDIVIDPNKEVKNGILHRQHHP